MKLVSFNKSGQERIGVVKSDSEIVDLTLVIGSKRDIPQTMIDFIQLGDAGLDLAEQALSRGDSSTIISTEDVIWLPPVSRPSKICGVALNNSASNSRKISAPDHPAFFLKPSSCLVGHGQPLVMRSYYGSMHPEPELALVIGKKNQGC